MSEIDDNALVDRAVHLQDQHAFTELVKRHQSALRYSIQQMCGGNQSLADDIAQETFIKSYTALESFKKQSKFSSWLYSIALNLVRQRHRSNAGKPAIDSLDDSIREADSTESRANNNDIEQQQLHRELAEAMTKLSLDQRSALHLFMHKQLSHQEIAHIMQIPLGSVKTHINRGRALLQQELASWRMN